MHDYANDSQPLQHPPSGWRAAVITAVAALCTAMIAGTVALALSREYYRTAPYHYDSAAYRVAALDTYDVLKSQGIRATIPLVLKKKDSLDILLRLLVAPSTLQHRYGHMVVLIPFMALFVALVNWYTLKRTGSWRLALLCPVTLFVFPLFYSPYWGIADYWRDNLATWLLGSAVIAWLLSADLRNRGWGFLAGLMLGLVAMQRTSAAVYAALLFAPMFVWAIFRNWKREARLSALLQLWPFVLPCVALAGLVLAMQARELYGYYFKGGYAYGTPLDLAYFLVSGFLFDFVPPRHNYFPGTNYGIGSIPAILAPVYLAACFSSRAWSLRSSDTNKALWIALGLPTVILLTSTYYYGFFVLWPTIVTALLATLCPRHPPARTVRILTALLVLSTAVGSVLQYRNCTEKAASMAKRSAAYRALYLSLAELITESRDPHQPYATFFAEIWAPLMNHARFELGRRIGLPAVFFSFHDQHFRNGHPDQTADQIVRAEMHRLEQLPHPIAIGHANVTDLYRPATDPFASAVISGFNAYLQRSPHWQVTQTLASPFGPLCVYRLSSAAMELNAPSSSADSETRITDAAPTSPSQTPNRKPDVQGINHKNRREF